MVCVCVCVCVCVLCVSVSECLGRVWRTVCLVGGCGCASCVVVGARLSAPRLTWLTGVNIDMVETAKE